MIAGGSFLLPAVSELYIAVDVAGILTALGALGTALLAHRRITQVVRRARHNERSDERESVTSARERAR